MPPSAIVGSPSGTGRVNPSPVEILEPGYSIRGIQKSRKTGISSAKDSLSEGYASFVQWTSPVPSSPIVLHGIPDSHILIIKKQRIARAGHNPGGGVTVQHNGEFQ
jgi:hypothetical protein